MIVVDASVWVSRLVSQDGNFAASERWMAAQRARGTLLVSPSLLLCEVAGAISRRTGQPGLGHKAVSHLLRLTGLRLVNMDEKLVRTAAGLAADYGLRGADVVYVALAKQLNLPLATWDCEQLQKASEIIRTQTPQI
jgi:predicted nucleic acid-binding protein